MSSVSESLGGIRRLRVRLTWTSIVILLAAAPARSEEVTAEIDFRGGNFDSKLLAYIGDDAAKYIKSADDGLRMRFAPGDAPKAPVGVYWKSWVIGNFTTTARYEILECGLPKRGSGGGVELWLQLDNPTRDGIAFTRQLYPKQGAILAFNHLSTNEQGKRYGKFSKVLPTNDASKSGRIRLARVGNEVIASIAEGDAEQFKEVGRTKIDDVDVRITRLAAIPGGDPNATLDLRILDFQVTGDLPGFDGVKLRSSKKAAAPARKRPTILNRRAGRAGSCSAVSSCCSGWPSPLSPCSCLSGCGTQTPGPLRAWNPRIPTRTSLRRRQPG